jgi:hypothetical protein
MAENSATKNIAAVTTAVAVVGGVASNLGGIVSGVASSLKSFGASVDSLFTSLDAGLVPAPYKLPMANSLSQYASYDYIISMACLTPDEYNYPDTSYMAGVLPTPFIFRGGSITPNNRIKQTTGVQEYYCSELIIKGQYGFEKGTGNTNSTNLEFTIIEPYSMGQFMQAIQIAARTKGYKNFNEAPYLLMIEFRGSDQLGSLKTVPGTKKFIPFNFNNMNLKVSGSGSMYQCTGVPCNAVSQADSVRLLKADHTIKGRTVQEILQTGANSLQAALNAKTQQQKNEKLVNVPDEYVILFPTDISSSGANGTLLASSATAAKETPTTATVDVASSFTDTKLFGKLNISRSSVNKTLVQPDGVCNDIGKAVLRFDISRSFNEDVNTIDANGNKIKANVTAVPAGLNDFTFKRGSDVINAINQVLLKSEIAVAALDRPPNTNGMRPWWRIDVQTYHIPNNANLAKTGTLPKLHVYRVVPYQVHASRMLAPNASAPGIEQLKKQAAKEYNYIYTGKNSEVLKFDIDVSNTFYQVFQADNFTTSGDAPVDPKDKPKSAPEAPVGANPVVNAVATASKFVASVFSTDSKGGSAGETQASRVARMFHDALINGMDMMNINMDIAGDPYYVANSGVGNYTATQTNLINVTKDGNVNYQNGEVDIVINFKTPTDLNQMTGMFDINNTKLVSQFSGLYKLTTITSSFKNGKFTQNLVANRRQGQDNTSSASAKSFPTTKTVVTNTSDGSTTEMTPAQVIAARDRGEIEE